MQTFYYRYEDLTPDHPGRNNIVSFPSDDFLVTNVL
jgi:hypothetical protein